MQFGGRNSSHARDWRDSTIHRNNAANKRIAHSSKPSSFPSSSRTQTGLRPAACEVCLDVHQTILIQSLASSSGGGSGYGDLDGIGLCPDRLAAAEVKTVHCSLQMASIHFDEEVVVVNLLALEGVTGSAFNG